MEKSYGLSEEEKGDNALRLVLSFLKTKMWIGGVNTTYQGIL